MKKESEQEQLQQQEKEPMNQSMDRVHPSHVTRDSDASSFDEICVNCHATNEVPGGPGQLAFPCSKPVGEGGLTYEEWLEKDRERVKRLQERFGTT